MTTHFNKPALRYSAWCRYALRWCIYAPRLVQICSTTGANMHQRDADMHHVIFYKILYNCNLEQRGANMHQQITTIYNILYSIYIIIYYLFVVLLLGLNTFVSNKLVSFQPTQIPTILEFPLFPSHHSLFPSFSSFILSFFISEL